MQSWLEKLRNVSHENITYTFFDLSPHRFTVFETGINVLNVTGHYETVEMLELILEDLVW